LGEIPVVALFGGAEPLGVEAGREPNWRRLVETGIPASAYRALVARLGGNKAYVDLLDEVVFASKHRARAVRRAGVEILLTMEESERAQRVARYLSNASRLLLNPEEFLFERHALLEGKPPVAWLRTEVGGEAVRHVLANIEFAMPV
jgi:uncharacterized protein (DUF2384 family)